MSIDVKKWPSHGIQELMSLCLKMYSRKRIKITIARSRKAMPMTIQGQVLHTYRISQYQHSSNESFGFFYKSVSFYSDYSDYECSIFPWKSKAIEVWMHWGSFQNIGDVNGYKTNTSCQLEQIQAASWTYCEQINGLMWPKIGMTSV